MLRLLAFGGAVFALLALLDDGSLFQVTAFQLARQDTPRPAYNALLYAGSYLLGVAGLVVVYAHGRRAVRALAYGVSALALAVFLGFRSVNGYGFTYHEASLVWGETDFAWDALGFFASSWVAPALAALAGSWVLARVARAWVPRIASLSLCLLPLAAGYLYHQMLEQTLSKVYQSPIPYRVPLVLAYTWEHRIPYYGDREAPFLEARHEPLADHIVLLMDESVSGDLFSLNGASLDTTPFLRSVEDRLFNYGVASSISNLSASTNLALQAGLRPDQFPDRELRGLKNPNLFSYAQAAGFRAYLIDDQIYSGRPNNMMSSFDLRRLDGHLQMRTRVRGVRDHEIDFLALGEVERIIRSERRSFVYLIKAGAHFPYDSKYPPDQAVFRPTLSDPGPGTNLEKTLHSYANALRWNVDGFHRELFRRFEGSGRRILFVYTADHGQSLRHAVGESGGARPERPTRWPHGIPVDPPAQQAAVPLLLFGFGDGVEEGLRGLYRPSLRDRVSQFELFPSLLQGLGYDPAEIGEHYHFSLFDAEAVREPRIFVSGNIFGMGGGFYNHELVRESCYLNEFRPEGDGSP